MISAHWIIYPTLVAVTLSCAVASTQDSSAAKDPSEAKDSSERIFPFLESSNFYLHFGDSFTGFGTQVGSFDDTIFEADLFPHLRLWGNHTSATTKNGNARYLISVTPAVRLRMLSERSAPVLSPSYMPRVNVQWFFGDDTRRGVDAVVYEVHVMLGHHSNGQSGCLFVDQDPDNECLPTLEDLILETGEGPDFNIRTASFSTNYVRTGATIQIGAERPFVFRWRNHFEYHFKTDAAIRPFYGRLRYELGLSIAFPIRSIRAFLEAGGMLSDVPRPEEIGERYNAGNLYIPEGAGWIRTSFFFEGSSWGLYAGLYGGQDYYNIGFLTEVTRLQVGVTHSLDPFMQLER